MPRVARDADDGEALQPPERIDLSQARVPSRPPYSTGPHSLPGAGAARPVLNGPRPCCRPNADNPVVSSRFGPDRRDRCRWFPVLSSSSVSLRSTGSRRPTPRTRFATCRARAARERAPGPRRPLVVPRGRAGRTSWRAPPPGTIRSRTPAALARLDRRRCRRGRHRSPAGSSGTSAYDLGRRLERLPAAGDRRPGAARPAPGAARLGDRVGRARRPGVARRSGGRRRRAPASRGRWRGAGAGRGDARRDRPAPRRPAGFPPLDLPLRDRPAPAGRGRGASAPRSPPASSTRPISRDGWWRPSTATRGRLPAAARRRAGRLHGLRRPRARAGRRAARAPSSRPRPNRSSPGRRRPRPRPTRSRAPGPAGGRAPRIGRSPGAPGVGQGPRREHDDRGRPAQRPRAGLPAGQRPRPAALAPGAHPVGAAPGLDGDGSTGARAATPSTCWRRPSRAARSPAHPRSGRWS